MLVRLMYFAVFTALTTIGFAQTADCVGAFPVCGNGNINLNSNGVGVNDFALSGNNPPSCQFVESQSLWLFIRIKESGTLGFDLIPANNSGPDRDDYDFAVYGPNRSCTNLGDNIRCSSTNPQNANVQAETGMNGSETDLFEGPGADGNGYIRWLDVTVGESYYILIDNFSVNEGFELQWTGTALLEDRITKEEGGVDLGEDLLICGSDNVVLDATTALGADEYLWSTGETSETIEPNTSGEYWVQVTNTSDCISRDTVVVTYLPEPEIFAVTADPDALCEPAEIRFTAAGSELNNAAYEWFFPDGSPAGSGTVLTLNNLSANNSGDFTLRLTNADGCFVTDDVSVTIFPLPTVSFSGRTSYCENETLFVESLASGSVVWKNPLGFPISTAQNLSIPNLQAADAGTYRLIVTSENNCIDSVDFNITIDPELDVIATSNSPICSNESLVLEAIPNGVATIEWFNPAGNSIGNSASLTIDNPSTSQSGTYIARAVNSIGCEDEVAIEVNINQSYLFESTETFCPGESFTVPQTGQIVTESELIQVDLLTAQNCDSTYTYDIVFLSCGDEACTGLPTAFAPNNNGQNETFAPIFSSGCTPNTFSLTLFDRWGAEVFSTTNHLQGWDGNYETGEEAMAGAYLWKMDFTFDEGTPNAFTRNTEGIVQLVR